ncbi:hypothetical protein SPI_09112 [Niveomyces insectorum RCEF 264]|uniref:Uncharacterized protein n=1 Tax=Niveomyces insectorum RCEF 264 TaxID=1081102 RepID=A0A162I924_9HYPO|nr:hypothetical protein SPI_09112 [Niveomyces insectorum RCEF 264]
MSSTRAERSSNEAHGMNIRAAMGDEDDERYEPYELNEPDGYRGTVQNIEYTGWSLDDHLRDMSEMSEFGDMSDVD